MKHCIDYCIRILLIENILTLEMVIKKCIGNVEQRKAMGKHLTAIGDYFKHEYETHIDTDEDPAHNSTRSLVGFGASCGTEEEVFQKNKSLAEMRA